MKMKKEKYLMEMVFLLGLVGVFLVVTAGFAGPLDYTHVPRVKKRPVPLKTRKGPTVKRVEIPNPMKPKPDLVIQSLSVEPKPPIFVGEQFTLHIVVKNQGRNAVDPATGRILRVRSPRTDLEVRDAQHLLSSHPLAVLNVPSLAAGSTVRLKYVHSYNSARRYGFGCLVDASGKVDESNENNNVREIAFSVCPKPDLVVSISVSPERAMLSQGFKITAHIKNNAGCPSSSLLLSNEEDSSRPIKVRFIVCRSAPGVPCKKWEKFGISIKPVQGSTVDADLTYTPNESGVYTVMALVNPDHKLPESNYQNNQSSVARFTVLR